MKVSINNHLSNLGLKDIKSINKKIINDAATKMINYFSNEENEISNQAIKRIKNSQEYLLVHIGYVNLFLKTNENADFSECCSIAEKAQLNYDSFYDEERKKKYEDNLKQVEKSKRLRDEELKNKTQEEVKRKKIVLISELDNLYSNYDKSLYCLKQQQQLDAIYKYYLNKINNTNKLYELDAFKEISLKYAVEKFNKVKTIKQKRKILIFSLVGFFAFLAIVFAILIPTVFIPMSNYNKGKNALEQGDYETANQYLLKTDWKDSNDLILISSAYSDYNTKNVNSCIANLVKANCEVVVNYKINDSSINIIYKRKISPLYLPNEEGYIFKDWSFESLVVSIDSKVAYVNLIANFELIEYTIEYELNGGTATNPTRYTIESDDIVLNNPTRENIDFLGWSKKGSSEIKEKFIISKGSYGDIDLIANWNLEEYEITYDLDGGEANNLTSYNLDTKAFSLIEPIKPGYEFVGWSNDELIIPTKNVTISTENLKDLYYKANWKIIDYTITYDLNGGTAENPSKYNIDSDDIKLNTPTKKGYNFIGWSTNDSNTPKKDVIIPKGSTGNEEYIANWEIITYSIDYVLNGGVLSTNYPSSYSIGDVLNISDPIKDNYIFRGWLLNDGSIYNGSIDAKDMIGDLIIEALWDIDYLSCFTFAETPEGYNITKFKYINFSDVIIPEKYNNKPIVSIDSRAFKDSDKITSIIINDGLTRIGENAFYGCSNLTTITLPESLINIDKYAFYKCTKLKKVYYNDNVLAWNDLVINDYGNPLINGASLYLKEQSEYVELKELFIPNDMLFISKNFSYSQITKIIFSNNVKTIEKNTFEKCGKLSLVVFTDSVERIEGGAFNHCDNLKTIVLAKKRLYLGGQAFNNYCKNQPGVYMYHVDYFNYEWLKASFPSSVSPVYYYYSDEYIPGITNLWHFADDGITPLIWKSKW